jgi:AcrR family transcriptional regulator
LETIKTKFVSWYFFISMETMKTKRVSEAKSDPDLPTVRERIIGTAVQRFKIAGFARVTVDDLCTDLAMSKKTFYKVFTSKDALVETIADRFLAEGERGVASIIHSDLPFVEKVNRIMVFMADMLRRIDRVLLQDIQRHLPHVWDRIQVFRRELIQHHIADLIAEGKRQGTIRPHVNARVFLLAYIGAIESVVVPSVLSNESFSGEDAVRSILTIFFNGVLTEDAGKELQRLQQSQL